MWLCLHNDAILGKPLIGQWQIQDFPQGENCMKMKEFEPPGGARIPGAPLRSANVGNLQNLFVSQIYTVNAIIQSHLRKQFIF